MTPIINPWIFYLSDVADDLKFWLGIGAFLFAIASTIDILNLTFEDKPFWPAKYGRTIHTLALVCLLLSLLLPSEKVVTKMVLAQNVTYERVEVASDTVKDIYEDILELFEKEE